MRLLIRFKRLYAVIVTYYYALNIFKPILTYYLLNVLTTLYYLSIYVILISLYAFYCRLCRYFAFYPCFYTLILLLNLNTFVFHSLKSINIFNLCRFCPHFGLV